MMNIKRVVLGLAAVTMLASCAKDISREEARKLVQGYEDANVIYKSGTGKMITTVKFSDNFPEALKEDYHYRDGTQEASFNNEREVVANRLTVAAFDSLPTDANVKFKADGKALEINSTQEVSELGGSMKASVFTKIDENGYPLEAKQESFVSIVAQETYTVTVTMVATYTWVK